MILGIVGEIGLRFTDVMQVWARRRMLDAFKIYKPELVTTSTSDKGGISAWAIDEARRARIATHDVERSYCYWKEDIARLADLVICISVNRVMHGADRVCKHCQQTGLAFKPHAQSIGCWIMNEARRQGKEVQLVIIGGDTKWTRRW